MYKENNDSDEILDIFENEIRKEFLGEEYEADFQQEIKRKRMENVMKLARLEIYDICYLEEYTCNLCKFDMCYLEKIQYPIIMIYIL